MQKKLIIIGSGGHGRSVAESIQLKGEFELIGFVDDSYTDGQSVWGIPVLGTIDALPGLSAKAEWAVVAIGNNMLREKLLVRLQELGFKLANIYHPASIISPSAVIEAGTVVMAAGIIGTEARVGRGVIVNCGAIIDHHCTVEDFGHLGVNTAMAGGSILGKRAWLQAGSALGYGVKISMDQIVAPALASIRDSKLD